jgi:diguanylate cyclase (GGDEF)-like protein
MTRKQKIFLVLSVVLLATDLGLVAINYRSAESTLMATVRNRGAALHESFDVALYTTELKLIEIATFVAQIEAVQKHLREGRQAVASGGSGGAAAERWRRSLMDVVGPRWAQLRFRYMLRQFAFYLPPDNTAFLRVDAAYEFGDRARQPESLVAVAAATHRPSSGFDIDPLSVGVRAAVPVVDTADGSGEELGIVEVGSALDSMLIPICPNSECGTSVLLAETAVRGGMAPPALDRYFTPDRRVSNFFIEATSNPAMTRALMSSEQPPRLDASTTSLLRLAGRWCVVTTFPLLDHLGKDDPARPPIGVVATWEDMDDIVAAFHRSQIASAAYAAIAFLLAEGLVWWLLTVVTTRLEREVDRRTGEVKDLLEKLSHMANHDPLTNLFNRRAFAERLHEQVARSKRSGECFSLVMLDIDHFKKINDTHGHPAGDEVLCRLATTIREVIRGADMAGRFGGEEFCLLLPQASTEQAWTLTERLKARLAETVVETGNGCCQVSFSAGIAEWAADLDEQTLLSLVDKMLYQAKEGGRNRIVCAPPPPQPAKGQAAVPAFSEA